VDDVADLLCRLFPYSRVTEYREAGRVVRTEITASVLPGREAEAVDIAVLRRLAKVLDRSPI